MDPQQELFTALLISLKEKYDDMVYDGSLPTKDVNYPFVYFEETQQIDENMKGTVGGRVFQTISVWIDSPEKRGTMSALLLDIKNICRSIEQTKSFGWCLRNVEQRIISDTSTKQPLLRGILDLEFQFS